MHTTQERRNEYRIRFSWPIWFGYDDGYGEMYKGQIIDLSNTYISFSFPPDHCPSPGQHVLTRFSYPLDQSNSFEMGSYLHWGEVIRVDYVNDHSRRIAMRLHQPINLKISQVDVECIQEETLVQSA